jgi:hypothetical protein
VTYQLGFILLLVMGVIGVCLSLMWLIHIILYMLPVYPISNLLNEVFMKLDSVFPLFGVAAFAAFCAYLMGERRAALLMCRAALCAVLCRAVLSPAGIGAGAVVQPPPASPLVACRARRSGASGPGPRPGLTRTCLHPPAPRSHLHQGQLHAGPQLRVRQPVPHAAGRHDDEQHDGQHGAHPHAELRSHPVLRAGVCRLRQVDGHL